ncbi:NAD(P)/FAD-dependent oxidoreductase [Planosporangium flavigriseum]|uniref:Ferredoxin--NADP reductase n=1 Tax=Planosporangium flavigriseum TaxID=373681 RepID=A0A8J3LN92_9ACTN|nr:NAD(P)/FAD-dependent oxidoreductase [Planosporangium flavigriseum]NJC63098.1 NAD(P)/FAD-dependent oxidoreductase [Planosporangium flavigriseum]GIG74474.1 ferredoxin--NADP reductase [Planosporangium flavigriseum]
MSSLDVDLLIVGAGPVGLFGAYYAGVRGLRTAVVDSLSQVGGQVSAMYPEKQIFDIAGFPAVSGRRLIANLVEQAAPYEPVYLLGQEAQRLDRVPGDGRSDLLVVKTSAGTEITAGAIVVTGGIGTFTPRPLPAGEEFLGRGLAYFVPDSADYLSKNVVIVGGGDSAVDWALMLQPIAATVTLVHRRAAFRAHPGSVERLKASPVDIITNAQVTAAHGDGRLERVEISVTGEESPRTLPCDKLVAALGFTANLGPLHEWGLELHDNRHLVVDSAMRTNVPGIFAAGDIADYDGKVRLIAVGFGEVATAVNNAAVHIDPDAQLFPGHSTDSPASAPLPVQA